jgi:hypothetical protein
MKNPKRVGFLSAWALVTLISSGCGHVGNVPWALLDPGLHANIAFGIADAVEGAKQAKAERAARAALEARTSATVAGELECRNGTTFRIRCVADRGCFLERADGVLFDCADDRCDDPPPGCSAP